MRSMRVLLALLIFFLVVSLPIIQACDAQFDTGPYQTTRRNAVIDFLAALQLEEGGFVPYLTASSSNCFLDPAMQGVEALSVVGGIASINKETLTSYVASCQDDNGAMYSSPAQAEGRGPPDMWSVDDAVTILSALGRLDAIDTGKLAAWILACQREDGGFNDVPGVTDTAIWQTYSAVRALVMLGVSFSKSKVVQNILTYYHEDGGFSIWQDDSSLLQATFYAVTVLALCDGLDGIDVDLTASFVMSHYNSTVCSFGYRSPSIFYTYSAVMTLKYLGRLYLVNTTGVAAFVLSCQSHKHGGFKARPDAERETVTSCRNAVLCLSALDLLSLLDEEFAVEEEPEWTGDEETPTTTTPTTTFTVGLSDVGVFLLVVAGVALAVLLMVMAVQYFQYTQRRKRKKVRRIRRRR